MKRFSAFIISLFVAALAFAQGSVTVTQSSAISDIVNNGGKPAKQTTATPQKQQTSATPQKQQTSAAPQTQQNTAKSNSSSESGNASSSSESASSSESSESKHDTPKPHVYSKQPAKSQKIDPNMTDEEKLAEHIQERSVDYSCKGKKVMSGVHKVKGWRIQIFNGGNKGADKKKAQEWAAKLKKQFPNMPVYVHFLTPRWMTMCGNYRTHKEAEPIKKKLIEAGFKYASIVRQQIVIE